MLHVNSTPEKIPTRRCRGPLCPYGDQELSLTAEFFYSKAKADGVGRYYHFYCRKCDNRRSNERLTRQSAQGVNTQINHRRWMLDVLQAYKVNQGCCVCGYRAHGEALEFDHLPGFNKVIAVSDMFRGTPDLGLIVAEIAKTEVVCANCHRVRTASRRSGLLGPRMARSWAEVAADLMALGLSLAASHRLPGAVSYRLSSISRAKLGPDDEARLRLCLDEGMNEDDVRVVFTLDVDKARRIG